MPRAVTGAVLAGGGATRFAGAPKGLEPVGGERIVDRVVAALRPVCDDLVLVANHPAASTWLRGVRVVGDLLRDVGSVAGIHAALAHAGPGGVLVVAWDMPFVPTTLLATLVAHADATGADAVVPESDSRRGVEPLCAWYGPGCRLAIEASVARDDRRVIGFFDDIRVARLPLTQVARHGDPVHIFLNVNTPDELARAHAHASDTRDHRS